MKKGMKERESVIGMLILILLVTFSSAQVKVLCWSNREDKAPSSPYLPEGVCKYLADYINANGGEDFEAVAVHNDETQLTEDNLSNYKILVLYTSLKGDIQGISPDTQDLIARMVGAGRLALLAIHETYEAVYDVIGLEGPGRDSYERDVEYTVQIVQGAENHPILRGFQPFTIVGEAYYGFTFAAGTQRILEGSDGNEVAWCYRYSGDDETTSGPSFYLQIGHMEYSHYKDNENCQRLVLQGVKWLAQEMMAIDTSPLVELRKRSFNYPNPFVKNTYFSTLDISSAGKIRIYNILGQLIKETTLKSFLENTGKHELASGIYFWTLTTNKGDKIKNKMVILR